MLSLPWTIAGSLLTEAIKPDGNISRHNLKNLSSYWSNCPPQVCSHAGRSFCQTSKITRTLVCNKAADHSNVANRLWALLQLYLHYALKTRLSYIGQRQLQDEMSNIWELGFGAPYIKGLTVMGRWLIDDYCMVMCTFYFKWACKPVSSLRNSCRPLSASSFLYTIVTECRKLKKK